MELKGEAILQVCCAEKKVCGAEKRGGEGIFRNAQGEPKPSTLCNKKILIPQSLCNSRLESQKHVC